MENEEKMSLYAISNDLVNLVNDIQNDDGELTEAKEEQLDRLELMLKTKADNVVEFMKYQLSKIELIDKRIAEFNDIKKEINKSIQKFDDYVLSVMDKMEAKEIKGNLNKLSYRKPSLSVNITDETKIPLQYTHTEVKEVTKILKTEIKKAINNGEVVSGATLVEGKKKLTYK